MEPIEQLEVYLRFTDTLIPVGQMVSDQGSIFFKYQAAFVKKKFRVIPF